jgi:hypothetical protein
MTNTTDPTVLYIKERITFVPWGILPLILFIIGHGPGPFNFIVLYNLLWGVFFFRVFDDYFCFDYESRIHSAPYLLKGKQYIIKLMCIFGFLYLSSQILIHNINDTILVFLVTFISLILYFFLSKKKWVGLVSVLSFPVLLFVTARFSQETSLVWVFLGSMFFLVRGIAEKVYGRKNIQMEVLFLFVLISSKLILRYI